MEDVQEAIAKDNRAWRETLSSLSPDLAGVLDRKVKSAIESEREAWNKHVEDTRFQELDFKGTFFRDAPNPGEFSLGGSGGSAVRHPFYVSRIDTDFSVVPGTVNAITPTLGGDPLDDVPAPTGTLSLSGTEYVYLVCNVTLSSANDYVYAAVLDTVTVDTGSTMPTDDLAAGTYYVELAVFVDGVKTGQTTTTSLSAHWCDDGTASSQATQTTERT